MVFVEEDKGVIKIKPKTKLRSLRGTWPELDIETITREIIEDREQDAKIEKEREKQIEMQEGWKYKACSDWRSETFWTD